MSKSVQINLNNVPKDLSFHFFVKNENNEDDKKTPKRKLSVIEISDDDEDSSSGAKTTVSNNLGKATNIPLPKKRALNAHASKSHQTDDAPTNADVLLGHVLIDNSPEYLRTMADLCPLNTSTPRKLSSTLSPVVPKLRQTSSVNKNMQSNSSINKSGNQSQLMRTSNSIGKFKFNKPRRTQTADETILPCTAPAAVDTTTPVANCSQAATAAASTTSFSSGTTDSFDDYYFGYNHYASTDDSSVYNFLSPLANFK